jgi:hypothetical protein
MKGLLIIAFFLPLLVSAQESFKPFKLTGNDLLLVGSELIAGAADGMHEVINTDQYKQGDQFWDERISWKNKYKDWPKNKTATFIGSKTFLVGFTDGYHFTNRLAFNIVYYSIRK